MHQIMTLKEVSEYLRLHPMTVYKLAREGEIPCGRFGKTNKSHWRFSRKAIDAWAENQLGGKDEVS